MMAELCLQNYHRLVPIRERNFLKLYLQYLSIGQNYNNFEFIETI